MATRSKLLAASMWLLEASLPFAQRGGPPSGGRPPSSTVGGGVGGAAGYAVPNLNTSPQYAAPQNQVAPERSSTQFGPPGRWWDDKRIIKTLKIRPDQQKRMDVIFDQNRAALLQGYQELKQEEAHLAELTKSKQGDEAAMFAQIDRIAQARATLEKSTTHLMMQLRAEMDQEQLTQIVNVK